jgi:hypothetical protein
VGKSSFALVSIQVDTGVSYWLNVYTYSNTGAIAVIDGEISPDNTRYHVLASINSDFQHIISVKIQDGLITRQARVGDTDQIPLGLAVSRIDRLAWNFITKSASSASVVNAGNLAASRTNQNLFVAHWDALVADYKCSDFGFKSPVITAGSESNIFTRTSILVNSI